MDVLLVDGYNVTYRLYPDLLVDLGHAREQLIADLAEYAAVEHYRVVLVFDSHSVPGQAQTTVLPEGITLIYTAKGETADTCIERLAYRLVRQGERVFVVTSDQAEQIIALGTGAYRISGTEFGSRLQQVKAKLRKQMQQNLNDKRQELASRLQSDIAMQLDRLRRPK